MICFVNQVIPPSLKNKPNSKMKVSEKVLIFFLKFELGVSKFQFKVSFLNFEVSDQSFEVGGGGGGGGGTHELL